MSFPDRENPGRRNTIRKPDQMNWFQDRNREAAAEEWISGHSEEGEGGANWGMRFDLNTLPCVK